jgi:hypothetical protein
MIPLQISMQCGMVESLTIYHKYGVIQNRTFPVLIIIWCSFHEKLQLN